MATDALHPAGTQPSTSAGRFVFDARDGTLYVDLQERLGTLLHLTSWQDGLELFRATDERGDAWESVELDLGFPLLSWSDSAVRTADAAAVKKFVAGIPIAIRDLARPFAWRQYPLLRLLRTAPQAISIVDDNPVLAWLLVDWLSEAELHPSSAHDLILGPRTEILRLSAGVRSRGAVNLLSRIRFPRYEPASLLSIRRLLELPGLQNKLAPLRRVSGTMLTSLLRRPSALHFPVWQTLAERCSGPNPAEALIAIESAIISIRDIERMAQQLAIHDPAAAYRSCTTPEALRLLHDRWAVRINQRNDADAVERCVRMFGTAVFPDPPVPGSETIRPIRTQQELSTEGAVMHHCVATYGDTVMRKRSYIYSVHAPERATLELGVDRRNVLQLACAHNAPASPETYRAVHDWLDSHRGAPSAPGG